MLDREDLGVRRWLGKILRLELTDGRTIEGKFVCTDNAPNIILSGCKVIFSDDFNFLFLMINGFHESC